MLCDQCKKREAVVHITKIENGRRTELHLCAECARKQVKFCLIILILILLIMISSAKWPIPTIPARRKKNRAAAAAE